LAIDDYFCHLCNIQRQQGEPVRGANGEILTPFTDLVTAQPCRLTTVSQRLANAAGGWMVATSFKLFLPATDATRALVAGDQVSEVILEDLKTAGPFVVDAVVPQMGWLSLHHVTLDLSRTA
jgi:hypothetical protein